MNQIRNTLTKSELLLLAAGAVVLVMWFSPAEAGGIAGTGCEPPVCGCVHEAGARAGGVGNCC